MDKIEQVLEMMTKMNDKMDNGFKEVRSDINGMRSDIDGMKVDINEIKDNYNGMRSDIDGMKVDINEIKDNNNGMKSDIKDIKMTLENEISKNIRIIAEGHFDLNHKLDEALKIENEKELLLIRLTVLENEVNRIKARLDEIA